VSGWGDFAAVIGAGTAALLGLLFVAVSIRIEAIAKSAELRNRTAQTLTLLLTGLLAAALLAVPDQSTWALGLEYLVLALVVIGVAVFNNRRAGGRQSETALARSLGAINPTYVTCSLLVAAGVVLILGRRDGIYVLVPALAAVLVGGVVNSWLILVKLTD
jgi:hypothetical protein